MTVARAAARIPTTKAAVGQLRYGGTGWLGGGVVTQFALGTVSATVAFADQFVRSKTSTETVAGPARVKASVAVEPPENPPPGSLVQR